MKIQVFPAHRKNHFHLIIRLRDELGKWKRVDGEYWVNPTPASNHAENSRVPVCSGVCLVVKVDSSCNMLIPG